MMTPNRYRIDDPRALIVEIQRLDFVSFLIGAFPHISGGANLDTNWHLDAIAYRLECARHGTSKRLLVTLPPRNLKSIMISVAWVAWMLGRTPSLNFVCVSYSIELAAKHARDCRALMQTAWYHELFPLARISARSAIHDFETTRGGGRLATSVGGTLTGRGGDIIIIDDPIKPQEAMSDTTRNNANDWYQSTLASRLNDKTTGVIICVMQRLHQYDLGGMLLESGVWDELSLPAIATEDSIIPLTRGRVHHRKEHDVLHPKREPLSTLLRHKASVGSVIFSAQYQQQPVPAQGQMIEADWLRTYDAAPECGRIVQSWDTASKTGINNDWSVCITAISQQNCIYIIDIYRRRVTFPELKKAAIEQARLHHASVLLIEDQASGMQLIQTLLNEAPSGVPRPIKRIPDADKKTRLAGVSAMMEAGQLLLPIDAPWLADFKSELLAFPSGRYDDQVDALSQLLSWVARDQRDYGLTGLGAAPIEVDIGPSSYDDNDDDGFYEDEPESFSY